MSDEKVSINVRVLEQFQYRKDLSPQGNERLANLLKNQHERFRLSQQYLDAEYALVAAKQALLENLLDHAYGIELLLLEINHPAEQPQCEQ